MKASVQAWMKEQMGDMGDAMIAEIYAEYRNSAQNLYAELKAARETGADFQIIDRMAHTLKGNALMVGDQSLFEVVQAWRTAIKAGDGAEDERLWPAIGEEVGKID